MFAFSRKPAPPAARSSRLVTPSRRVAPISPRQPSQSVSPSAILRKPMVGGPDDLLEREAGATAEKITGEPVAAVRSVEPAARDVASAARVAGGGGRPLPGIV